MAVRVRPCRELNVSRCVEVVSNKSLLFDDGSKNRPRKYGYDFVFAEEATQVNFVKS